MYTKQQLEALYHAAPLLRKTLKGSMNEDNDHIKPSALHPHPPQIGTTWGNGRYSLVDINHVNRMPASHYFYDPFGGVRAYEPRYTDQWFIIDEQEKTDADGHPIVFEYPFGWTPQDVKALNDKFFRHPNIVDKLNNVFIRQLNELRVAHDLPAVALDASLAAGSFLRTEESCASNYVHPEHVRPNGERYHTAFLYRNATAEYKIGENQVAMPYNGNAYSLLNAAVIDHAMTEWKNSPTHLDNFLHEPYRKAYITVQVSERSPWIENERTAFFTPSVYVTCHMAID